MSTRDFFKNSVLEAFGQVDPSKIGLSLLVALAMGILIYCVYKRFFTGVVYSRSFAVTLVGMCVLTCMVTLAISTNVVISLGMVGALSIVRYRTAVKDPLDLLYLFWAITTGITAGAGMYALVGLTAVVIVAMIAGFASHQDKARVYMMVIHYTGQTTGDDIVRAFGRTKFTVKSKTMRGDKVEMAVEVFSDGVDMPYADAIRALADVCLTWAGRFGPQAVFTGIMVKAISMTGVLVVKMKDVAELAGVSSAAVSRYLNGGYISADKAERIKQAIELTGYVRSSQARALRTGSTKLIGVIVPKINSESVSRITAGIGQVLGRRGYQMLLANTDNAADRELEYLDLFQNHPVDGIVLVATMITDEHRRAIESCRVPIVLIGQNVEGAACVYHDDYEAAFELGHALAGRVDGKIAYIGVTEEDRAAGYDRRRGFEAGLRAAGNPLDAALIRLGSFTLDSGYGAARELLSVDPDVSFIACATDTMAAGALRAIDEVRGMGEGIHRVSGFGDNAFLRALTGGIPTVHYGYLTSGVEATNMLLNTLDGVEGESGLKTLKLGHQLMNV